MRAKKHKTKKGPPPKQTEQLPQQEVPSYAAGQIDPNKIPLPWMQKSADEARKLDVLTENEHAQERLKMHQRLVDSLEKDLEIATHELAIAKLRADAKYSKAWRLINPQVAP